MENKNNTGYPKKCDRCDSRNISINISTYEYSCMSCGFNGNKKDS